MKTRKTSAAGSFYPALETEVDLLLDQIMQQEHPQFNNDLAKITVIGGIVPHACFSSSGKEAIHFFDILGKYPKTFDTFVLVYPDHNENGLEISIDNHDNWDTPYGAVNLDQKLINLLPFDKKELAHKYEHSGEVMLPFLKHFLHYPFKILPIAMSVQNLANARFIASELHKAVKLTQRKICIIASSDFSHTNDAIAGESLDQLVIDEIQKFNVSGVEDSIHKNHIHVCGFGAIMTLMEYALLESTKPKVEILAKGNSSQNDPFGEISDYVCGIIYTE